MGAGVEEIVVTLGELAGRIGARLVGDGSARVTGINSISQAGPTEVCFASSKEHAEQLRDVDNVAGVIVSEETEGSCIAQLVVGNVQRAVIDALNIFSPRLTPAGGIHAMAVIEETACLAEGVSVGPWSYIGHKVKIGAGTAIAGGCCVGEGTVIGQNCRLDTNVVIYHNCSIGENCIIQANATIGACGFGYYCIDGRHELIPHNGGVIIEDCVEIGANSCVDRAKFGNTIIGAGTKIDNSVQIAHNVVIGKCCLLAAQVGIGGSSRLGNGVMLGGQVGVVDNVKIGDGAMVGGKGGVIGNIAAGQQAWGVPARELKSYLRSLSALKRLPKVAEELKALSKRVEDIEASKNDK